jgi:hypothetical protein
MAVPDAQALGHFLVNCGQMFPLEISHVLLITIVGLSFKSSMT